MSNGFKTSSDVRTLFNLAVLRRECASGLTGRDWKKYREVEKRALAAREKEDALHKRQHDTRMEQALRRVQKDAGKQRRDLQAFGLGQDRFDKQGMFMQAKRDVEFSHENRIARINRWEHKELSKVVDDARANGRMKNVARRDFSDASRDKLGRAFGRVAKDGGLKTRSRSRDR